MLQMTNLDEEGHPPTHAGTDDPPKDVPPGNAHSGEEVQDPKPEGLLIRRRYIIYEGSCAHQERHAVAAAKCSALCHLGQGSVAAPRACEMSNCCLCLAHS